LWRPLLCSLLCSLLQLMVHHLDRDQRSRPSLIIVLSMPPRLLLRDIARRLAFAVLACTTAMSAFAAWSTTFYRVGCIGPPSTLAGLVQDALGGSIDSDKAFSASRRNMASGQPRPFQSKRSVSVTTDFKLRLCLMLFCQPGSPNLKYGYRCEIRL
jgi:hypothetical protein